MSNLFEGLPSHLSSEFFESLAEGKHVRIERIVSNGHSSPIGFWYDQDQVEWVAVLKGEAKMLIEGEESPIHLTSGDCLTIPAHKKHRVEWTAPDAPTIWLAVFFEQNESVPEP